MLFKSAVYVNMPFEDKTEKVDRIRHLMLRDILFGSSIRQVIFASCVDDENQP
jgi:hypothetical protein